MTLQERLARLPQDKHITYACAGGPYYSAQWHEAGVCKRVYLGKDIDGMIARRIAASGQRQYAPRHLALPCKHAEIHLNCEICIRFATWQMRERTRVS